MDVVDVGGEDGGGDGGPGAGSDAGLDPATDGAPEPGAPSAISTFAVVLVSLGVIVLGAGSWLVVRLRP